MKKKPAKSTEAEYVLHAGCVCPVCGSDDVVSDGPDGEYDYNKIGMRCHCDSCDATWDEIYTLTGYDNLVEEEQHV